VISSWNPLDNLMRTIAARQDSGRLINDQHNPSKRGKTTFPGATKGTSGLIDHGALSGLDDDDHSAVYHNKTDLASTSNGEGASLIGIEDSAGDITATTVEGALAEIASDLADVAAIVAEGDGVSGTITVLTNYDPGPGFVKTRDITITDGIVTAIGAESDWLGPPL